MFLAILMKRKGFSQNFSPASTTLWAVEILNPRGVCKLRYLPDGEKFGLALAQHQLRIADVTFAEGAFAVGEVKVPHADESFIKTQLADRIK